MIPKQSLPNRVFSQFWPQSACMCHFTYDIIVSKQFINASTAAISAPLLYAFPCHFESAGLWTCPLLLDFEIQVIRALVLKHASVFQRCGWGPNFRTVREIRALQLQESILCYLAVFENSKAILMCFAPWVDSIAYMFLKSIWEINTLCIWHASL